MPQKRSATGPVAPTCADDRVRHRRFRRRRRLHEAARRRQQDRVAADDLRRPVAEHFRRRRASAARSPRRRRMRRAWRARTSSPFAPPVIAMSSPLSAASTVTRAAFQRRSASVAMARSVSSLPVIAGESTGHSAMSMISSAPRRWNPRMVPFAARTAEKIARRRPPGSVATVGFDRRVGDAALRERRRHLLALPVEVGAALHVLQRAVAAFAEVAAERRDAQRRWRYHPGQLRALAVAALDLHRFAGQRVGHEQPLAARPPRCRRRRGRAP